MENAFLNPSSQNVMKNLLEQALKENESSESTWIGYKNDLEEVKKNLKSYSEKLTIPIMIPLCSKAMIPGKLVHTNQVLVGLGDNWFSKVSTKNALENCDRKIKICFEMLEKYEKEKQILGSRLNFPMPDEGREIIEPYNEEDMAKWREGHREMEKKYHREKNEEREVKVSLAEEELWRKLEELELQEELEDQLLMNGEVEVDDVEGEDEEIDSGHSSEEDSTEVRLSSNRTVINEIEPLNQYVPISDSSSYEDNVIKIEHSQIEPKPTSYCTESPYQTPACIHKEYLTIKNKHLSTKKVEFSVAEPSVRDNKSSEDNIVQHNEVLKNITEDQVTETTEAPKRPMSKFKASRKS